jgi:hypothetical protein
LERGSRAANTRALATSVSPNVLKPLLETGCRSVRQTDVDYWSFATFLISGRDRRFRGKPVTQEHPAGVNNDVNEPKGKSAALMREVLKIEPDLMISTLQARMSYVDDRVWKTYSEGLRRGGLPE